MKNEYKTVVYMGSFNPPHLGHLGIMDQILREREMFHLFVRYNDGFELTSWKMKQKWFERISEDRDGRIIVHKYATEDMKGKTYGTDYFVKILRDFEGILGAAIDEVWVGDDGAPLIAGVEDQFSDTSFRIIKRNGINSTAIRKELETRKKWLPDFVYEDLKSIQRGEERCF